MRNGFVIAAACSLAVIVSAAAASAELSADELARLGKDLTPLGAEKAGNADGSIPPWEGGITAPPPGYREGGPYVDPYAGDQPILKITAANMDRYADRLTEGHKALLRTYDPFFMNIYPTRRSVSFAPEVYEQTRIAAATAKLADDGNGVVGAVKGFPFPIPKSALEVLWNHGLRPHGYPGWNNREHMIAAVTRSGDYTPTKMRDWAQLTYWHPDTTQENIDNILWKYRQDILSPPRLAGRVMLLHDTLNQALEARKAWVYNPGQRRVRRAPEFAFDNPWEGSDGLMTIDQAVIFNGSPERYEWKLVGKKEMYIPYNAYRLNSKDLKYKDILKPLHPDPSLLRYELHRVWVIDGTLKSGERHLYKRRTLYIDEDGWQALVSDLYDNRDELWRVAEDHSINYYNVPLPTYAAEMHYDLQAGRYAAAFLSNEEPPWDVGYDAGSQTFTTQALRRSGRR